MESQLRRHFGPFLFFVLADRPFPGTEDLVTRGDKSDSHLSIYVCFGCTTQSKDPWVALASQFEKTWIRN